VSRLQVHLDQNEAVAAAYLRAAHAYMLISMPTGTSTILGVFQAILALLVDRTSFSVPHKVVRNENFASEIFCLRISPVYAAMQKKLTQLCSAGQI
jgi:hypothetical protein